MAAQKNHIMISFCISKEREPYIFFDCNPPWVNSGARGGKSLQITSKCWSKSWRLEPKTIGLRSMFCRSQEKKPCTFCLVIFLKRIQSKGALMRHLGFYFCQGKKKKENMWLRYEACCPCEYTAKHKETNNKSGHLGCGVDRRAPSCTEIRANKAALLVVLWPSRTGERTSSFKLVFFFNCDPYP